MKAMTLQSFKDGEPAPEINVDGKKENFKAAVSEYFSTLSFIDVNLRRQIYALEEANIIQADAPPKDVDQRKPGQSKVPTAPGLGNLDVSWLNSRDDKVGKEMEAEVWTEARELVGTLVTDQLGGTDQQPG